MVIIRTVEDYRKVRKELEVDPLLTAWDSPDALIQMWIQTRVEIQNTLFRKDVQKYYRWIWENKLPHICEETGRYLANYSAAYVSHILTRGAHPEKALDPRNMNYLSFDMHQKWEFGDRKEMRIYWKNEATILKLNAEYRKLLPQRF